MITSALYYPHTTIRDPELLKTALVLWDELDVIVPFDGFTVRGATSEEDEALELIARARVPTREERTQVHSQIVELANRPAPEWLQMPLEKDWQYLVYPQKILPETWDALRESRLAAQSGGAGPFEDYVMSKWLGLLIMSALAAACAGASKRLVTDEQDGYASLNRYIVAEHEGELLDAKSGAPASDVRRLVTIGFRALGFSEVSLKTMIALRRDEDAFLRQLRQNYLGALDACVEQLQTARHAGDRDEIERGFEQSLRDDLRELNRALRRNAASVALSQEMLVAFLALAGTALVPYAGAVAIGALGKAWVGYRNSREQVMQNHAMSWLYRLRVPVV